MRPKLLPILSITGIGVLMATGACFVPQWTRPSPDDLLKHAQRAIASGELGHAAELLEQALRLDPDAAPVLLIAAEVAEKRGRHDEAISYLGRVPAEAKEQKVAALERSSDLHIRLGRVAEAESDLLEILKRDPAHAVAHRRMAALLVAQGRRWESGRHLFELLRNRQYTIHELALLANLESLYEVTEELQRYLETAPGNPIPLLGIARLELYKQQYDKAEERVRGILQVVPDHIESLTTLGKCLVETGTPDEFFEWHASLPPNAEYHPDVWAVRGRWCQQSGEPDAAIRCYWEAVQRNPNHLKANYQLAQLLVTANREEAATPFLKRAELLETYTVAVHPIRFNGVAIEFDLLLKAGRLAEQLGRPWEAWAWYNAASVFRPELRHAHDERDRIARTLTPETPQTLAAANPALRIDCSSYPLPQWGNGYAYPPATVRHSADHSQVAFQDDAESTGIDFSYWGGGQLSGGIQLHRTLGGGIGVLDFDLDGWPDLHFAQGCDWPVSPGEESHLDVLYRNLGTGRFSAVTESAGIREDGFSHGVSVGDFDADGFPDLYIGNLGANRLYRNNGDGTFVELTAAMAGPGSRWTTSVLLADLNADGLPDVYDAVYLDDSRAFHQMCYNKEHDVYRSCAPNRFSAGDDRLHISEGDGTFRDVSSEAGILAPDGRGLGVLAANLEGAGCLDLFVANDMTANFYFVNQTQRPGNFPRFEERGYFSGLALDFDGATQASMGIAADDADGNGLVDFFVTNFYNESNTLYLQQQEGMFVDSTRQAGLREAGLAMLGFGTQFIDAELDGLPDLIVTNGHIDDFRHEGIPLQMRPQFFTNRGQARFEEVRADSLGEYFQKECLGRALARLDWNRDGLEDFVVSHLDVPTALLSNRTIPAGRGIGIRLRGTDSDRDALGTTIRVFAGGRSWTKQLTAGDGYLVSNERRLLFGLGEYSGPVEIKVRWPSGREQTFESHSDVYDLLLIEGSNRPLVFPGR